MPGFDPKNRRVIVTGGAQGLGLEFAHRLLLEGAKVCISDIDCETGEAAADNLRKEFGLGKDGVHFAKCDVTAKEEWVRLWNEAEEALGGKVDILMNNAGVPPSVGVETSLNIMVMGATIGAKYAIERMSRSKGGIGGRILTTASAAGIVVSPFGDIEGAGYSMAKFANVVMTRMFPYFRPNLLPKGRDVDNASFDRRNEEGAKQLKKSSRWMEEEEGIKAFAICPWFVPTRIVVGETSNENLEGREERIEKVKRTIKRQVKTRMLVKEEVSDAMMHIFRRDKNGSVNLVFPDIPVVEVPDHSYVYFMLLVAVGKVAAALGLEVLDGRVFLAMALLGVYLGVTILNWLLAVLLHIVF